MADEVSDQIDQETPQEPSHPRRRGLFRLIKAVAFVSVIVVVEVVVASMLAPTAQDTARLARELVAASSGEVAAEKDESEKGGATSSKQELHEVELGAYNITRYNPASKTTLAVDFELYATVLASDLAQFQRDFESNKARIREQVTLTLHSSESADFTDPGLGLIKRRILEKTNRALGQPLVKEVLFSKFNFVER